MKTNTVEGLFKSAHPELDLFAEMQVESNWFERLMARHGHPVKFILDMTGYMWGLFMFWHHKFAPGLAIMILFGLLGTLATLQASARELSKTALGKFMLLRTHPANYVFQVFGFVMTLAAVWEHSGFGVMFAATLILIGHCWGWSKVNDIY